MSGPWFTADDHFGHAKIIEHSRRPFRDVHEMDAVMIERWNAVVRPRDDVYHLGDFDYRAELIGKDTRSYRDLLNGRIHMVWGNHDDKNAKRFPQLFSSVQDVKYLRIFGQKIWLSHYAHRVWRASNRGSWHLFGHSHGCLPPHGRSLDVGVDAHHFRPWSFEEIHEFMRDRPFTMHHPEREKESS